MQKRKMVEYRSDRAYRRRENLKYCAAGLVMSLFLVGIFVMFVWGL